MEVTLVRTVETVLSTAVLAATRVHGGDVAAAFRLDLADGRRVFAKTHHDPPPEFFVTEAAGLAWLRDADAVAVPEVLAVGDDLAHLVLEWIEEGPAGPDTDEDFGRSLAHLHRAGAPGFGREDRRTTGSRSLPNDPAPSWAAFYAERRLVPLAVLAERAGALRPEAVAGLHRIAARTEELLGPAEPPARLHGDLWGGNRLVDVRGRNWLVDPAAFGGHREFDLAMMRLFGGFGARAHSAYEEEAPLGDGWAERVELHQLAPLVVHAIKFGGGYVGAATRVIDRYV
jgi:fructosamine-3-kinase